jgi:putative transposon-encoded protein
MVRKIKTNNGKLTLSDEIETIYEKKITKFGTGAKIDAPKEHIGKKVYVLVRKNT